VTFLRRVLAAPVAGAVPAIAACALLRVEYPPTSLAAILGEGAMVAMVYLCAVCVFGLNRSARRRYVDYVRHMIAEQQPDEHPAVEAAS
jgi:hypothetical protein